MIPLTPYTVVRIGCMQMQLCVFWKLNCFLAALRVCIWPCFCSHSLSLAFIMVDAFCCGQHQQFTPSQFGWICHLKSFWPGLSPLIHKSVPCSLPTQTLLQHRSYVTTRAHGPSISVSVGSMCLNSWGQGVLSYHRDSCLPACLLPLCKLLLGLIWLASPLSPPDIYKAEGAREFVCFFFLSSDGAVCTSVPQGATWPVCLSHVGKLAAVG